ncbi:hypothetical protein BH09PAT3_BH09PAT3_4950 [soil metagenome]
MSLIWIFITLGGLIGSYIPVVFGADGLSPWSIVAGTIGSLIGVWLYKQFDL